MDRAESTPLLANDAAAQRLRAASERDIYDTVLDIYDALAIAPTPSAATPRFVVRTHARGRGCKRSGCAISLALIVSASLASCAIFLSTLCPFWGTARTVAFVALLVWLTLVAVAALGVASLRDAGVLAVELSERPPLPLQLNASVAPLADKYDTALVSLVHGLRVRGSVQRVKWCAACGCFRLPRAHHCAVCDVCVDRFDHHCPWVSNCVGRRNHGAFAVFTTATAALAALSALALAHVAFVLARTNTNGATMSVVFLASTALAVFCALGAMAVGSLAFFHLGLIARNETTLERLKGTFARGANPYSLGAAQNCAVLCCLVAPSALPGAAEQPCEANDSGPYPASDSGPHP